MRERKILGNIYGLVYNNDLGVYEKKHDKVLCCLLGKPIVLICTRYKLLEELQQLLRTKDKDVIKKIN